MVRGRRPRDAAAQDKDLAVDHTPRIFGRIAAVSSPSVAFTAHPMVDPPKGGAAFHPRKDSAPGRQSVSYPTTGQKSGEDGNPRPGRQGQTRRKAGTQNHGPNPGKVMSSE